MIPDYDLTETFNTDNLHNPVGIIRESMEEIKRIYGSRESFYIVNGSTSALHIAMMSATNPGDKILIQRNSHMSVYNGTILCKLNAEYLMPKYDLEKEIIGSLDVAEFELKTRRKDIKAAVILNPSFYGLCPDLEKIIEIAKSRDIILIVDEAHGPHLKFNKKLPLSAVELGADFVIHSTHKTLPALTQTSLLHICSEKVDIERVRQVSRILQTSSPSYIFLTSMEQAVGYMDTDKARIKLSKLIDDIIIFENNIKKIDGIKLVEDNDLFYKKDITKIIFGLDGISGDDLRNNLHENYGIDMEYADLNYVVGILSVMNDKGDLIRLEDAIKEIAKNRNTHNPIEKKIQNLIYPEIDKSIQEAFYSEKERIPLEDSIGRTSASYIIPYPPGIPQLAPGEIIKEDHILLVEEMKSKIEIIGLIGDRQDLIEVLK